MGTSELVHVSIALEPERMQITLIPAHGFLDIIIERGWFASVPKFFNDDGLTMTAPGDMVILKGDREYCAKITKIEQPGDSHGIEEFKNWWKIFWQDGIYV